ncbi:hypothetical protein ACFE04_008774 [Oxalis oulophora]
MEFEDHEEEIDMGSVPPGYDSVVLPKPGGPTTTTTTSAGELSARKLSAGPTIRYRECLKNHAVSIGAHALDGCGEFMPAGDEGTLDALKCAACNCHRNFHRKETEHGGDGIYSSRGHPQFSPYYRSAPPLLPPAGYLHLSSPHPRPLALPAGSGGGGYSREEDDVSNPSSSGGGGGGGGGDGGGSGGSGGRKRFRSKFSQEQKDKMLEFAERLGWRLQKHDEAAVEQFCTEAGISRQVLKVWMHNNKHTLGKKP